MKKFFTIVFIAISAVNFAQKSKKNTITDSGNVQIETRTLETYTKINNYSNFDVILTQGTVGEIRIETSDNILEYVITSVEKGELTIKLDAKNDYVLNHKSVIYVPVNQSLTKISQSGAAEVEFDHLLEVNELTCELKGSGELKINVKANKLLLDVNGTGEVETKGNVTQLEIKTTGSAEVEAEQLMARKGNITLKGTGNIAVYVYDKIAAKISGSGKITVKGNTKNRDVRVSGSGEVIFK